MRYQKQFIIAALILTMTMGTLGCAIKEDKTLQANVEAAQEEKNEEKKEEGSFAVQAEGTEPKKEETVYIGDSEVDIAAGKNAMMQTVSVAWGFRTEEELKSEGAGCLIHRPEELLGFF